MAGVGPGGGGGLAPAAHGSMMQQNMLSDGDIGAAMFNANANSLNAGGQGAEQADGGMGPAGVPMQMSQMIPGRRSLLVGSNTG